MGQCNSDTSPEDRRYEAGTSPPRWVSNTDISPEDGVYVGGTSPKWASNSDTYSEDRNYEGMGRIWLRVRIYVRYCEQVYAECRLLGCEAVRLL
jgi:hypothetical protein